MAVAAPPTERPDQDTIAPVEPTTPPRPTDITSSPSAGRQSADRARRPTSSASSPFQWTEHSPKQATKPKKGILGFLTVKEPSTSAWVEFAQQHKADTVLRGNRSAGLNNQKLPDTVPAVNSKWDGLPSTAHSRSGSGTFSSWKRSIDTSHTTPKRSGDSYTRSTSSHSSTKPDTQQPSLPPTSRGTTVSRSSTYPIPTTASPAARPFMRSSPTNPDIPVPPALSVQSETTTSLSTEDHSYLTDFSPTPDLSLSSPRDLPVSSPRDLPVSSPRDLPLSSPPDLPVSSPRDLPVSPPRDLPVSTPRDYDYTNQSTSAAKESPESIQIPFTPVPDDSPAIPPDISRAVVVEPRRDSPTLPSSGWSGTSFLRSLRGKPQLSQQTEPAQSPGISVISGAQDVENDSADAPDVPRLRRSPLIQDSVSDSPVDSSPTTPTTLEEVAPAALRTQVVEREEHPAVTHSRKRSTENAPQWPLPQSPGAIPDAYAEEPDDSVPPPVPLKSARRVSVSSIDSDTLPQAPPTESEPSVQQSQLEGALSASPSSPPSSSTHNRVRSFSRPLPRQPSPPSHSPSSSTSRPQQGLPMGTISIVRDSTTYTTPALRAPPAFQPGRVLTKDSDLATIPESDTTSLRTVSAIDPEEDDYYYEDDDYDDNNDPALKTSMYLDTDTESEFDNPMEELNDDNYDDYSDNGLQATPGSQDRPLYPARTEHQRVVSEESWLNLTPRERLGLGSSIRKQSSETPPWGVPGDEGNGPEASTVAGAEDTNGMAGKKTSFIKAFKRI